MTRSTRNLKHTELTSNRLPTLVLTRAGTVSNFEKPAKAYFLHLGELKIVSVKGKLFISHGGDELACCCTENRVLATKMLACFNFAVEICYSSLFAYNFYSFKKYTVLELSFVQRNYKMLSENFQT